MVGLSLFFPLLFHRVFAGVSSASCFQIVSSLESGSHLLTYVNHFVNLFVEKYITILNSNNSTHIEMESTVLVIYLIWNIKDHKADLNKVFSVILTEKFFHKLPT